jgi:two-component sensor histidine kinase
MRGFKFFLFFIFCGIIQNGIGQDNIKFVNQLKLASNKADSIKVLIEASEEFRFLKPEKGLETSILAHSLSLELMDTTLLILSSNKKALLQKENSLDNLALGSIINSLDWANKYKNDSLLAYTGLVAGHVYSNLGNSNKSLLHYENALSYFINVNDSIGLSYTYSGMGIVKFDLGNNLKALDYYLLSEKFWVDSESSLKADLWNNIGAVYMELENFDEAKLYYEKALITYKSEGWLTEMSMVYYNIGELELFRGNVSLSSEYYNKSLAIGLKINSPTEVMWAYEGLYLNTKYSSNYKKSLDYFEKHTKIKDSLSNAQNLKEVRELEVKYEQDENLIKIKEQEAELYQKEINVHAEELKNFIFGAVIFLILILLGIGILFYFRIKKKNALLESQKQTISQSLFEKEILLKEIHHRVKNNMQVISSLLNLQKNTTDSKEVEYVISETQNRIQAIALVHQKLYQSKDIEGVDFETYLTELIDLQMGVFQNKKAPLELIIDLPKAVQIKLDLAISLGLIISEVITNAFKYAFNETHTPRLIIKLYEVALNKFELNIRDNGPGVPENYLSDRNESLGKELIQVLTEQINGEMNYKYEDGASFYIIFPL